MKRLNAEVTLPDALLHTTALLLYPLVRFLAWRWRRREPRYAALHHYFTGGGRVWDISSCPEEWLTEWKRLARYLCQSGEVDYIQKYTAHEWFEAVGSCHVVVVSLSKTARAFVMRDRYRFHPYCDNCNEDIAFCQCGRKETTWRWAEIAQLRRCWRLPWHPPTARCVKWLLRVQKLVMVTGYVSVGGAGYWSIVWDVDVSVCDYIFALMPGHRFRTRLRLQKREGDWETER